MLLENLSYTDSIQKLIKVDRNGKTTFVTVADDNIEFLQIQEQIAAGTIPAIGSYSAPDMSLDEFRMYRKAELNRIDTEVANAERWDNFTAQEKANVRSRKQKLKDLPASVNLTGVAVGDKAAAEAKFATTPALP